MTTQYPDGTIEFRFYRPNVDRVTLVGDFNGWDQHVTEMRPESGGWWACELRLPPGNYLFRYRAGGNWFLDYESFGLERGPLGWNSVLCVSPGSEFACSEISGAAFISGESVKVD